MIFSTNLFFRVSLCIPEFKELTGDEQKILLLQNLDPMFNIKSGFFFQTEDSLTFNEQLEKFSIFDISSMTRWLFTFAFLNVKQIHSVTTQATLFKIRNDS